MIVGACEITLHLPECHSLKEKRQIIQSIMGKVRHQFAVAVAEVEDNDRWQIASIGISCISNSSQQAGTILERVQRYIEETRPDLLITDSKTDFFSVG